MYESNLADLETLFGLQGICTCFRREGILARFLGRNRVGFRDFGHDYLSFSGTSGEAVLFLWEKRHVERVGNCGVFRAIRRVHDRYYSWIQYGDFRVRSYRERSKSNFESILETETPLSSRTHLHALPQL